MGCDLDDLLAYTTERKVAIRHRWVGGLYYTTIVGVLAYVLVELFLNQGYNSLQPLAGSMRATVRSPSTYAPFSDLPYCTNAFNISCVSWDQNLFSTVQPDVGLLIATRIKREFEVANPTCNEYTYGCNPWVGQPNETRVVYMGDVEGATVLVQHAASKEIPGQLSGYNSSVVSSFQSDRPTPKLLGANSSNSSNWVSVTKWCSCLDGSGRAAPAAGCASVAGCTDVGDLFTVGTLLQALGISLSSQSSSETGSDDETLRYAGLTVRLAVRYDSPSQYTYLASANEIEAKLQSIDRLDAGLRMVQDVHGMQLLFAQGTGYYAFDVRTLILTLVSGLALLSVAKTVADSFLLYVSPRAKDYALWVKSATPDFSPDSEGERKVLDQVLARKRAKNKLLFDKNGGSGGAEPLLLEPAAAVPDLAAGGAATSRPAVRQPRAQVGAEVQ